jgi:hypothetical protein
MKKDDYLTSMMMIPPKQPTRIHQFDVKTQQEAFAVSPEGLKSVCPALALCDVILLTSRRQYLVECHDFDLRVCPSSRGPEEAGEYLFESQQQP